MNKNYYDILQVNRNASPEIIEKAYKTLAKKYHPDLQTEENKRQAEETLKKINEAYEILSVPEKKQIYDTSLLEEEIISKNSNTKETNSSTIPASIEEELKKQQTFLQKQQIEFLAQQELLYQKQLQQAKQKAYYDAYIQDLKNRGYKIRYKKTFKDYIKGFATLFFTIVILFLLWQIPLIQNFFLNLLQENQLLSVLFHL